MTGEKHEMTFVGQEGVHRAWLSNPHHTFACSLGGLYLCHLGGFCVEKVNEGWKLGLPLLVPNQLMQNYD